MGIGFEFFSTLLSIIFAAWFGTRLNGIYRHTKRSADSLEELNKRELAREFERIRAELAQNKKTET